MRAAVYLIPKQECGRSTLTLKRGAHHVGKVGQVTVPPFEHPQLSPEQVEAQSRHAAEVERDESEREQHRQRVVNWLEARYAKAREHGWVPEGERK